jgi:hypothetical protein
VHVGGSCHFLCRTGIGVQTQYVLDVQDRNCQKVAFGRRT